ncbi:MAG: hypothetical protein ACRBFS_10260 [Aureispira sp.]
MKRIGLKILKGIGTFFLLAIIGFGILYLIYNEPLPKGKEGAEAQALLEQLNKAVNKEAWDKTRYLQWSFAGLGTHDYLWDRERHLVEVKYGDTRVLLNPSTKTGEVYENGVKVTEDASSSVETAYAYFTNDAFWLNAFVQIEQPNIKLEAVDLEEENGKGLLVTYESGGVTPGDAYLWIFDENGLPKAWKMWVKIIPIGGVYSTWENWETLPTGAKVARSHSMGFLDTNIENLRSFQTLEEGGMTEDVFASISN